jgi:signal transduction histidine kinase/CheY-like chemotaxis protein
MSDLVGSLEPSASPARRTSLVPDVVERSNVERPNIATDLAVVDVLVVDDDPRGLTATAAMLEGLGANLLLARSGEEALRILLVRDVAVILLDVKMPGLSGLETAAMIRMRERSRWTPIIFLTAHAQDVEQLRRGYALGAVDFLAKPVAPDEALRAKVTFFMELHRRGEALRRNAELLRAAQERDLERNLAEARRRWEEESLRRERDRERRLVETLHRANERLRLLSGIREDLLSARCLERLPAVLDRIARHLGLERYALWLVTGEGLLELVAHGGTEADAAGKLAAVRSSEDVVGSSAPASGPGDPRPPASRLLGAVSCIARLCVAHGRTVAVGAFGSSREDACEGDVADTLALACDGVAMAIERERLTAELQRQNEALADVDQRKDQFLAMLGHELRNPLAPILNAVKLLKSEEVSDGVRRMALDAADRQAHHMARLVDDLLDVTRIRSGKIRLRRSEVDLARVVEAAVQTAEPLVRARHHALRMSLPDEPVLVDGDPVRLTQVVGNLLTNAAKYTDPGGHLSVVLARAGDTATVVVEDDGIGIAADLLPRVFEPFVQGEQAVDRSRGGLGIGLSLVRTLVELHGGTVTAHSGGPGKGTRFTVELPALAAPAERAAPSEPPRSVERAPHWTVLLVEDNEDIRTTLAELLRRRGHDVVEAENGEGAIEIARGRGPDVALVDIGLPGLDGFEVARRLREVAPAIRLVAMTGYGSPDDRRRGAEAGFAAHLVKPVDFDGLAHLLASLR